MNGILSFDRLFHVRRNGRISIRSLRDGEPVDVGGAGAAVAEPPAVDPNAPPVVPDPATQPDVMSALEDAMKSGLGEPDPAQPGQQTEPTPFDSLLGVSEFVKEPGHVENAVRAADEVWKVASGQLPAHQLLEGMRQANPDGFQAVVQDLVQYIEQITGAKFGGEPQASPLDELKASNPQAYEQIAQFFKQQTGKDLGAPPDPRDARLAALEERYATEQQQREVETWNQQVEQAKGKALAFLAEKSKGTIAEGDEAYFLQLCGAKAGIPEQQMVQMLLSGDTAKLEAAYKAVMKDETARVKRYNERLIANYRKMSSAVPGAKGAAKADRSAPARKEGETDIQYATRLWNEGQK